ncbi:MAG: glycosyltransferase [Clostridia bacterium]|nr:glycosyltransferase [Clostridia bacterium]
MENKNNGILLSFILPIYNVEDCLGECIESILVQITEECEIILVDDGATDSSGEICDRYSEKHSAIRVVHKENGGLSSARNAGLQIASGKYVSFVDSDDMISSDCVSQILEWIKNEGTDLCFMQVIKFYPDGTEMDLGEGIVRTELRGKDKKSAVEYLASRPKYPGSAWAKLFRREFLLKNDLHFPYDRRYSEDLGFILDSIVSAESIDALDFPFYRYRLKRKGSITNNLSSRNFYDLITFIDESLEKLTVDKKAKDDISRIAMGFVAYEYSTLIYLYNLIRKEDKKDAMKKLRQYKWILKYRSNKMSKLVFIVSRFCGIRMTAFLLKKYRKATYK